MNTYIKLPIKNLIYNKKRSTLLIFLIVCCIIFFLLATYFLRLTDGYYKFQEIYNIRARTFTVSPVESIAIDRSDEKYLTKYHEIRHDLLQMPHVVTSFCSLGDTIGTENALINGSEVTVDVYGANHKTPLMIKSGRHFQDGEKNAILVPSGLVPSLALGDEIIINIDPITRYSCKIVGIYNDYTDSKKYYIPVQDVEDLNYMQRAKMVETGFATSMGRLAYTIIVDDLRNIIQLQQILTDKNYLIGDQYYTAAKTNVKDFFSVVSYTISAALAGIVMISVIYISSKCINERKYEIGILKAIGYKNRQIRLSFLSEFLILGVVSYTIAILFLIPLRYLLRSYMNRQLQPIFDEINPSTGDLYFLALFGIAFLLYLSVFFSLQRINRITASDVLKS